MSTVSVARAPRSEEEIDNVIQHEKAKGDAVRPLAMRLVPHRADHVEKIVFLALRKLGVNCQLARLVADYGYLDALPDADPDEWSATAQATRIDRRLHEAGKRLTMTPSRVHQLRGQACEPLAPGTRPLLDRDCSGKGGRGRTARHAVAEWLRTLYAVSHGELCAKPAETGDDACTNPAQTLHPSVRDQIRSGSVQCVPQSPLASASQTARDTAEAVAIWDSERSKRYQHSEDLTDRSRQELASIYSQTGPDDFRHRVSDFFCQDGDTECCARADASAIAGHRARRRHRSYCRDYAGYEHSVDMFVANINHFGHGRRQAS
jgi:hypothetical protein